MEEIKSSGCQTHRANAAEKSLKVHIPAGISDGKSIRLRGKGMPGLSGGKAGDLLLKVRVGQNQDLKTERHGCILNCQNSVHHSSTWR